MTEGRESPEPESQTGSQLHNPPADGHGLSNTKNKREKMTDEVKVRDITRCRQLL